MAKSSLEITHLLVNSGADVDVTDGEGCARYTWLHTRGIVRLRYYLDLVQVSMLAIRCKRHRSPVVTGSWDGSAVRPVDQGKFCNRTSTVWIRVVSSCYTDGLVFHKDQYLAVQGCDSVVLVVVALVCVRVCLCLFTISGST
jgi:hypothetical protein